MTLATIALAASLATAPPPLPEPFFGEDKIKHFVASFVVTSLAMTTARIGGLERDPGIAVGASFGFAAGVAKEFHDARRGQFFSIRDLLWDIAGMGASAAVQHQSR
jgi:putative lipoprotein